MACSPLRGCPFPHSLCVYECVHSAPVTKHFLCTRHCTCTWDSSVITEATHLALAQGVSKFFSPRPGGIRVLSPRKRQRCQNHSQRSGSGVQPQPQSKVTSGSLFTSLRVYDELLQSCSLQWSPSCSPKPLNKPPGHPAHTLAAVRGTPRTQDKPCDYLLPVPTANPPSPAVCQSGLLLPATETQFELVEARNGN